MRYACAPSLALTLTLTLPLPLTRRAEFGRWMSGLQQWLDSLPQAAIHTI